MAIQRMFAVSGPCIALSVLLDTEIPLSSDNMARVFHYQINAPGTNTPLTCMNQCAAFGFSAAAVEVSSHFSAVGHRY